MANSVHVIAGSTMLQMKQLFMDFIFPERIVTARPVEVDDVTGARILQNRLRASQRLFENRWVLHVAVAAVGESVLGDDARRSGR
jgi:hypothetical protein